MRPTHLAIMNLGNDMASTKKMLLGSVCLCISFAAATFGLTLGAAEYSKETKTSATGLQTVKGSNVIAHTGSAPRVLSELSQSTSAEQFADLNSIVVQTKNEKGATILIKEQVKRGTFQASGVEGFAKISLETDSGNSYNIGEEGTTVLALAELTSELAEVEAPEGIDKADWRGSGRSGPGHQCGWFRASCGTGEKCDTCTWENVFDRNHVRAGQVWQRGTYNCCKKDYSHGGKGDMCSGFCNNGYKCFWRPCDSPFFFDFGECHIPGEEPDEFKGKCTGS